MLTYAGARDGAEAEGDDLPDVLLKPPGIRKAISKASKASRASSKAREGVGQKLKLMKLMIYRVLVNPPGKQTPS
jgi:hypothetical protein